MLAMQVLRRGDQHGVDGFVVQQPAMIQIAGGIRGKLLGILQPARIDIGECGKIDVGALERPARNLGSTVANADDSHADPVVRAEHALRHGERGGETGSHGPDEFTA